MAVNEVNGSFHSNVWFFEPATQKEHSLVGWVGSMSWNARACSRAPCAAWGKEIPSASVDLQVYGLLGLCEPRSPLNPTQWSCYLFDLELTLGCYLPAWLRFQGKGKYSKRLASPFCEAMISLAFGWLSCSSCLCRCAGQKPWLCLPFGEVLSAQHWLWCSSLDLTIGFTGLTCKFPAFPHSAGQSYPSLSLLFLLWLDILEGELLSLLASGCHLLCSAVSVIASNLTDSKDVVGLLASMDCDLECHSLFMFF